MATTFFGSPPFVSHPLARTPHFSSSSQTPPQQPPPSTPPPAQPLSTTSTEPPSPITVQVQKPKSATSTKTDSTDWIASSLTRRFGIGAGLAWAGFLAIGVISEQIKTRLEVCIRGSAVVDVDVEVLQLTQVSSFTLISVTSRGIPT